MKNYLVALFLLTLSNAFAQTVAVTEYGDTIYVYDNGTWSFDLLDVMPEVSELDFLDTKLTLDTISTPFTVNKQAQKEIENKTKQFKVKYNEKVWKRVPPATLNDDADFAFEAKNKDIWCVIIAEETEISKENLFRIAKNTMAENTGASTKILKTEIRNVNGTEVLRGVLNAEISGISFVFDTYYFSNEKGSVQFTTWTSDKIWESNESMIVELLNGFIVDRKSVV